MSGGTKSFPSWPGKKKEKNEEEEVGVSLGFLKAHPQ
jgi:hypothetical protein